MRKIGRRLLRMGGVIFLLLLAGLWLCLEGVAYRPYFKTPAYLNARQQWQPQATNLTVHRGKLEAGYGRVVLTPDWGLPNTGETKETNRIKSGVPLAGYGSREGRPAQGVHDDVHVKAVALRVAGHIGVMVSADALIIPREVAEIVSSRLKSDLGLSREQIYFGATHTHSSLGGWGEGFVAEQFAGPFQPEIRTWFAERLIAVVRAAVDDLKPASVGHGRVAVPGFVRNRLVGDLGQVDPELSFLVVKQTQGQTAILGSYAAHATVLSAKVMEFSGDYPGYWQRAMEQATGGIAVFFGGGMGSHGPAVEPRGFPGAERMGQALAQTVLAQLPQVQFASDVSFSTAGLEVALPELHVRVTDGLRLRPWLVRRLLPLTDHTFLQVFRVNDVNWVSTPCDFSGELALELKQFARARGIEAVITSFNGDYVGYVIPHRYYHLSGYEPRVMSFLGPNLPDYFQDLIRMMLATP